MLHVKVKIPARRFFHLGKKKKEGESLSLSLSLAEAGKNGDDREIGSDVLHLTPHSLFHRFVTANRKGIGSKRRKIQKDELVVVVGVRGRGVCSGMGQVWGRGKKWRRRYIEVLVAARFLVPLLMTPLLHVWK